MRKLIWCGIGAGVVAASGFLSLAYYACSYPDTSVARGMFAVAEVSLAIHPLNGMYNTTQVPPSDRAGGSEECVPEDPKPVPVEPVKLVDERPAPIQSKNENEADIVIPEDDLLPGVQVAQGGESADRDNVRELPAASGSIPMPKCEDDDERPMTPPRMPYADEASKPIANAKKPESPKEKDTSVFEAWRSLFETGESKSNSVEMLPLPTEEEQSEPKCEEDSHRHEQYPGCPRTTCPYTGKSYPAPAPSKSSGAEESSEEPPAHPKQSRAFQNDKQKGDVPHPAGVDTMEFRKSDDGQNLNEYGPNPIH